MPADRMTHPSGELQLVGIAPIRGQIHRTVRPLTRPGWAVTVCGIRKRLVPAEWRKPEDKPCGDCFIEFAHGGEGR